MGASTFPDGMAVAKQGTRCVSWSRRSRASEIDRCRATIFVAGRDPPAPGRRYSRPRFGTGMRAQEARGMCRL